MRTILLVLQSETFRSVLHDALKDHYKVIAAKDHAEGTAQLDQRPDALLLDLFLPGTDGLNFLKENRAELPPAILLFATFYNSYILQAAADLGVATILLKPCSLCAVQKWLDTQV